MKINNVLSRNLKVVIPAAGLGTRLLPATIAQPKEMIVGIDKTGLLLYTSSV